MPPSPFSLAVLLVYSLPLIPTAVSATTLYTWRNADGTFMFTDNPNGAPPDVQVHVWTEEDVPPSHPAPESTPGAIAAVPPVEGVPDMVTQGEFAIRLVEELGLEDRPDADEATDILTKVRIAPRLGRWELDEPMTPDLTTRLRSLTAAAAVEAWITLTPEEGLLAFDTTAALLGVAIPETGEMDRRSGESSLPFDETPPLVYATPPPPEVYPYYLWQPVAGGYWWNGVVIYGIYVLDFDRHSDRFHRHRHKNEKYRDGHATMTPDRIGHQFRRRIAPRDPEIKDSPRPRRSLGAHESYRSTRPQPRPPVASSFSTLNDNRIVRGSAPSEARSSAPTWELPRPNRPSVRSVNTRAIPSDRAIVSTGGSSNPNEGRIGVTRGQGRGRQFSSR